MTNRLDQTRRQRARGVSGPGQYARAAAQWLAWLCAGWLSLAYPALANDAPRLNALASGNGEITLQRYQYQRALEALSRGKQHRFEHLRATLVGYPLTPYLDYRSLRRQLRQLPFAEVDRFLASEGDSYLGYRLRYAWLSELARQGRWQDYRRYYQSDLDSDKLACHQGWALWQTGNTDAAAELATRLWLVGKSQDSACDPLFAAWESAGGLTQALIWERHQLALANRKRALAAYLGRKLTPPLAPLGELARQVDRNPSLLRQRERFAAPQPEVRDVILHGVQRLARRDPLSAHYHWQRYEAARLFDDTQKRAAMQAIMIGLARRDHRDTLGELVAANPQISTTDVTEWLLRDSLRQQDWAQVLHWLPHLPEEAQQEPRWRYWHARALAATGETGEAQARFAALALQRSFYGFLSADRLGQGYSLLDRPLEMDGEMLLSIARLPALARTRELHAVNDVLGARREWRHAMAQLTPAEKLAAGKLAQQWGWYDKSIRAAIHADYWDDLQMRFPLAYQDQFLSSAEEAEIDHRWLFAVARQESAFIPDARSRAGALGLLQIMPATARYTARKTGLHHRSQRQLLDPEHNITLGSRYLSYLLEQFDGDRIYATAAYNAGPHRVRRWLQDGADELPHDIWIETIPFRETRHYVQNVLAFSVIYGYRLGEETRLFIPGAAP